MHWPAPFKLVTAVLVAAGTIAGASPTPKHNHQHLHAIRRSADVVNTVVVPAPGPTVVAFVFNGKTVSKDEVCEGIDDGDLQWNDPAGRGPSECASFSTEPIAKSTASNTATEVAQPLPSSAVEQKQDVNATPAQSSQAPEPSTEPASSTPADSSITASPPMTSAKSSDPEPLVTSSGGAPPSLETSSSQSSSISGGQGLDLEFPDGTIDCSTFPSEYGPIDVEWANLGGWAGIQYVTVEGDSVTNIVTAVPGGKGCIPGAMCSYACPPGYQKSQWPSTQGSTGQSVGGIQCNSAGKLSLTNPGLSKTLCMKGTGATIVQNKLSNNAAICRTDYPGLSIA